MNARVTSALAALVLVAASSLAAQQQKAPPAAAPQRPAAPAPATAQQRPGAPAPAGARGAAPAAPAAAQRPAAHDTVDSMAIAIDYRREVYNYQGASRDPFASLLSENATQTTVNDLRLVAIAYDARGGASVATVRDKNSPRPYRLRRGDTIGRLRVIQIRPYEVVFQVEEFGFERQEVLQLQRVEVNR